MREFSSEPRVIRTTKEVTKEVVGIRSFVGWPFLQEGRVDSSFKYEEVVIIPGSAPKIIANPHSPQGLSHWKMNAERIEQMYSKTCGVITGDVDVLVHVQPLKGMKRLETGAFVKDYEGPDKEIEQAVQMVIPQVASEDLRFLEKDPPPLSEEFPDGCKNARQKRNRAKAKERPETWWDRTNTLQQLSRCTITTPVCIRI